MNNPEDIVILPGKSFSKNELIKRLTQMGIEHNVPNGPKVYYDQLYDRSIKNPENQKKIYEKLIWDANFTKNSRRTTNTSNTTLRAYGINSEEQSQRTNPKTTVINGNLGFNGNLNEDTGRKNFEELPPNMKSINTKKNKFESAEQQYQPNKFYPQSNSSFPTSEFRTNQQLKTIDEQNNKFEIPYKEQFEDHFNNNQEDNDRFQWKKQIPSKNINTTPRNFEDNIQNEDDNFNMENKFTSIPKSNYPLNKKHSSSNISNPFINNSLNQDFENDNKYSNLGRSSSLNEMRSSNEMRQSFKGQGAFTNPKSSINYINEQNADNNITSKQENITLSTKMRPTLINKYDDNINPTKEFQNDQEMEEERELEQNYPLEKQPDSSYLNYVYIGGFGILGLFSLIVLFYVIIKREVPSFMSVFNPAMIIRDFLIPSLGRWGRRFFIDYVFVTIAICIVCAVSYFLIKKRNKNNIIKNIFEDIKRTLKEIYEDNNYKQDQEQQNEFSGMPENEIIIRYSNYYNIRREVFEREYMPILRDMRRKDENIKLYDDLYQGRKQIFWRWVK